MADVLTREETSEILENVYKDNFEGTELAKKNYKYTKTFG